MQLITVGVHPSCQLQLGSIQLVSYSWGPCIQLITVRVHPFCKSQLGSIHVVSYSWGSYFQLVTVGVHTTIQLQLRSIHVVNYIWGPSILLVTVGVIDLVSSVRYFPKGPFPSGNFPRAFFQVATSQMCNFSNDNFPSGNFPMKKKQQLPKCTFYQVTITIFSLKQGIAAVLGPLSHPSRSARLPSPSQTQSSASIVARGPSDVLTNLK